MRKSAFRWALIMGTVAFGAVAMAADETAAPNSTRDLEKYVGRELVKDGLAQTADIIPLLPQSCPPFYLRELCTSILQIGWYSLPVVGLTAIFTGGALALASGDDAVHAEESISISGGDLTILRCYEGFEAAEIAISGGTVRLTASDDGINVVAPGTSVAAMPGRGAMPGWGAADTAGRSLTISGGYIWVDAGGDGLPVILSHGFLMTGNSWRQPTA